MSMITRASKVAIAVSAVLTLGACSSGGSDEVDAEIPPTASAQCTQLVDPGNSYSASVADLVVPGTSESYQLGVLEETTSRGSVSMDVLGNYTYTPNNTSARGYSDSFTYAVSVDGVQQDSAIVSFIYGAKRIMPLGDSITYGVTKNTDGTADGDTPTEANAIGYRKALFDQLTTDGYLVDFVGTADAAGTAAGAVDAHHQGLPGWTADELNVQLDSWMTTTNPDMILMHAGTNDLGRQIDPPATAAVDAHELVNTMNIWHDTHQPVTVLAAKIVRPNDSSFFTSTIANTLAFNTALESQLSNSFDNSTSDTFKVHMVDQYNALNVLTDINSPATGDFVGLHPSTAGYQKMADAWQDALMETGELVKCP